MAGPLDLVAAARLHHPAPALLVVTGGEAFPPGGRPLPPHVQSFLEADALRAAGDARALNVFADDVVFHGVDHGPLAGPHHGPAGVLYFFIDWMSTFEEHESRLELVIDLGDRIVSMAPQRGRSRGVEVEMVSIGSWWFRDGKVVLVRWFDSLEAALAA